MNRVVVLLLLSVLAVVAQTTATIAGTVRDSSGAVAPNAKVLALNEGTKYERAVTADNNGAYLLPLLPIGTYTISGELAGFRKVVQRGVVLTVDQNVRVDLALQVGDLTETINVEADASQVDTRQATISHIVDQKRVTELPLNGRNPALLAMVLPGAAVVNISTRPSITGSAISMNGSRPNAQQFLLDGSPFNAVQRSDGLPLPPPDVIQEFRVIANGYSAEYGRNGGGVFSTITRSGTNDLHGSLWEFLRNDKLNARNFFSPSIPTLRQNQYGFTVSGPVFLPRYNGRNKTFFVASWQGQRIREVSLMNSAFPPTEGEKSGDFSSTIGRAPNDPSANAPFPGARVPASLFDPVAVKVLARLRGANTADGRYVEQASRPTNQNQVLAKIDHQISAANSLSVKYWLDKGDLLDPWPFSANLPWSPGVFAVSIHNASLNDTHIFSPRVLNQFRASFTRRLENRYNTVAESAVDLGVRVARPSVPFLPNLRITGRMLLATQINGQPTKLDNTFMLSDTLTWNRGKHALKFGWSLEQPSFHGRPLFDNGDFTFSGQITGNALSDFLIGKPVTFSSSAGREDNNTTYYWGGFAQDDVRVSERLTLNLGVRYQYFTPMINRRDRTGTIQPGVKSQRFPDAPLGLVYPGDNGLTRALYNGDRNDFAPRIGIAWDPRGNGRTAVRAGYGVFFQFPLIEISNILAVNQPFVINVSLPNPFSLSDPWRGQFNGGVNDPIAQFLSRGRADFFTPVTGSAVDRNFRDSYIQQYSLSIQHQVASGTTAEIAYVGNSARKLHINRQLNPAVFGPGATVANTNARRRLNPGTLGAITYYESTGNSNYNSLQVSLNRRFSRGLLVTGNYTWSKAIDFNSGVTSGTLISHPDNPRFDVGLADFDRTSVVSGSLVWEVPVFKNNSNKVVRYALAGWQPAGLWRFSSGGPFHPVTGRDNSLTGINADRPNVLGDPNLSKDRTRGEQIARYFDPAMFDANRLGEFGNTGRNSLRGPGFATIDLSMIKNFKITERHAVQFRAEIFNLFNHANLGNPGTTWGTPTFGRILSAADPRLIQLALKYSF